jgi:transposase
MNICEIRKIYSFYSMDSANSVDRPSTPPSSTPPSSTPPSSTPPSSTPPSSTPPSSTPHSSSHPSTPPTAPITAANETTRDQRLQAQTLHDIGLLYTQIRDHLGLTLRQIQYAICHRLTPKKRSGRPPTLTEEEVARIIDWACATKGNRRTPWAKIPIILELDVSHHAIRTALRNAGYSRRVARRKPPISERNRLARLQWAIQHLNWTIDDWRKIL